MGRGEGQTAPCVTSSAVRRSESLRENLNGEELAEAEATANLVKVLSGNTIPGLLRMECDEESVRRFTQMRETFPTPEWAFDTTVADMLGSVKPRRLARIQIGRAHV